MASLKMAGVDLRSIVKKDEPDLVFLDGNTASILIEDPSYLASSIRRDYSFWLMAVDPMDFLERELLTKRFFHSGLVEKAGIGFSAQNRVSLEIEYQWGWMDIDFIDHTQDPMRCDDRTDEWLATPDVFTRDQKLFAIEIKFEPIAMTSFMERRADAGDHSLTDRLIDMDLIDIALKYNDAFFHGSYENQHAYFSRPGRNIKGFEGAVDTWIFYQSLFGRAERRYGHSAFFALRKHVQDLKAIYALGNDWLDILDEPPFSGLSDAPYSEIVEGYVADFPRFRGRDPLELFRPKSTD